MKIAMFMKIAVPLASLGAAGLLGTAGLTPARAIDIDDYRWDHDRPNCRVVETRSTNRWGTEVTVLRRVCE
jgi:hypothetical protein